MDVVCSQQVIDDWDQLSVGITKVELDVIIRDPIFLIGVQHLQELILQTHVTSSQFTQRCSHTLPQTAVFSSSDFFAVPR